MARWTRRRRWRSKTIWIQIWVNKYYPKKLKKWLSSFCNSSLLSSNRRCWSWWRRLKFLSLWTIKETKRWKSILEKINHKFQLTNTDLNYHKHSCHFILKKAGEELGFVVNVLYYFTTKKVRKERKIYSFQPLIKDLT